ncbi:MAG: serine/threonine protein kinase [Sandaracinaceae bacterium]|nr:serine/threonine protein kinase [Sandaracinaceae bacterium]
MARALDEIATPSPDPRIGSVLDGRYRIVARLGEGGMGLVYEATHVFLKTRVAIKVLRPDAADRESIERLKREAQAASAIGDPHIVDVRDFGELADGSTYVVMELVEGIGLLTELRREPLRWERARDIALQITEALGAAHERGIVHRDLKPENVLLTTRDGAPDYVKLVDFGIARVQGATKLTAAGRVVGTPEYMAPEQCAGIDVDHRADVYALGIVLYEMLTGKLPFHDAELVSLLRMQIKEPPVPPSKVAPEADIPLELEAIVLRCLAKRPSQRFQSMADLGEALRTLRAAPAPAPDASEPDPFRGIGEQPTALALEAVPARATATPARVAPGARGVVVIAALVLTAGAAGAYVVARAPASAPSPPAHPGVTSEAQTPPVPATPAPEPPRSPAGAPADAPRAPARSAQITLDSHPSGARAFQDGALIGETPLALQRPAHGERVVMTLSLRGHQDQEIAIGELSAEHLTVTLAPRRAGRASPSADPGAPAPEPGAQPPAPREPRPAGHRPGFMNPWEQ